MAQCSGGAALADSAAGSVSGSSQCSSDCVSAVGSPERPSSPVLLRLAEKRSSPSLLPGAADPGSPADRALSPSQLSARERQLVLQNRLLKSSLIRALEKLELQLEDSGRVRRLLSRLLKLHSTTAQRAHQLATESTSTARQSPDQELYARYQALVKQNYQLEQALQQSVGGQTAHGQLEELRAVANMQMTAMKQDWQDERQEKHRALALNAQLQQQVEQLQHQLEQLRHKQQPGQPLSEPFESLEPSNFTGSSSWEPQPSVRLQPRRMLPPPGFRQAAAGGFRQAAAALWPTSRAARDARTRGLGPARSVEEVLSAPYEALRTASPSQSPSPSAASRQPPVVSRQPAAGSRQPPVESDVCRPLPPPARQPAVPLLPLCDSGYSEVLAAAGGPEEGPLQSRVTEEDWTHLWPPSGPADTRYAAGDQYSDSSAAHQVTCPHCGTVFAATGHLLYLNHVEECPCRRRRRPG